MIGDIHGRLDLLNRLIAAIWDDAARAQGENLTITLGDYIDRGPDSKGVLERLSCNPFPDQYIALKGNHEDILLRTLSDPDALSSWRRLGGLETLHSFRIPLDDVMRGKGYGAVADELNSALSKNHRDFLASLRPSLTVGRYFFCHAGVRPGVPLSAQTEADLLWIREEFLNWRRGFEKIIVHGHTPIPEPEVLSNRINIDTGAFVTGRLTCMVLEAGTYRFLTT